MKSQPASLRTRFTIPSLPAAAAPVICSGPALPAGSRSTKFFIPAVLLFAGVAILTTAPSARAANTPDNVTGTAAATPLDSAASYSSGLPGTTSDVIFTSGTAYAGTFTLNSSSLSIGTLDDLNTTPLTISASQALTLNGGTNSLGASSATVPNSLLALNYANPADLLYVTPGGTMTIGGTGGIVLGTSGNFDIASSNFSQTAANGAATINSVISDGGNGYSLTKTGVGTLTLTAANTYTGATNVVQGNLTLNFAATGAPASNIVSSSSALTLGGYTSSGGGSLYAPTEAAELPTLLATAATGGSAQTFNGLTVNTGTNQLIARGNGTGSMTVNLGTIAVNTGGSINFSRNGSGGTGVGVFTTTNTTDASGLISGVGGAGTISSATAANSVGFVVPTDYATVNGNGQIVPYTAYTALPTGTVLTGTTTTNTNGQVTASAATALTVNGTNATTDINTLSIKSTSGAFGTTVTIGTGDTLRFGANGGVLDAATGATPVTITGGSVTAGGSATANNPGTINLELVPGGMTIASNIVNNGSGAVSVVLNAYGAGSSANALSLTGTNNTFSGGLFINSGRVLLGSSTAVGTGTITIGPAGQLQGNGTITNALVLEGSGGGNNNQLFDTPSALRGGTFSGLVTLEGDAGVSNSVSLTGQVTGPGGLMIGRPGSSGATGGNFSLSSTANNYQGNTTLTEGTLTLNASNVIPDGSTAGNVVFANTNGTINPILNLNGKTETINGLAAVTGVGVIANGSNGTTGALTVGGNNATATYGGAIADNVATNGTGLVSILKTGTGTETFSGKNTFSGGLTINGGTVVASGAAGTPATGLVGNTSSSSNQSTVTLTTGTTAGLAVGQTVSGGTTAIPTGAVITGITSSTTFTISSNATATTTGNALTFTKNFDSLGNGPVVVNNTGTLSIATSGALASNAVTVNAGGTLSNGVANGLTGTSSLTLGSGAAVTLLTSNNYSGATTVNGTLTLGNGAALTASNVTVGTSGGTAGTLATAGASNTLGGSLTVNSGGTVNMQDGATSTLTVSGAANLYAGTASIPSSFKFDLGSTNNVSDVLAIGGAASASNAGGQVFLNALGPLTVGNAYTVVTAASGLNTNGLTLGSSRVSFGGTAYSVSLTDNATSDVITVNSSGVPTLYWTGANGTSWSQTTPGTNFSTSVSGTPDAGILPSSLTDVNFAATGAAGATTTLDAAFTVNSLNFLAGSAAYTVAPGTGGTLTINAGGLTDASANAQTITAPITLGGLQTWSNTGTALLSASGSTINNGGFLQTLSTTAGGGNILISDTLSGAGGLATTGSGASTISGPINITGPISLAGSGITMISGSISGATTLTTSGSVSSNFTGTNATFTGALALGSSGTTSIGALLATTGGLTQTAGTVTLSNTGNTFSGGLTVAGGTLQIDTINNVSTNGELGNQTSVTLGSTGANTGTLEYTGTTTAPSSTMPFTLAAGGTGAFQIDNAATNLTLSGVISGSGTLSKTGPGTLTLSGVNTYTIGTSITGGTVVALNAATNLGNNASTNTINIGASGTLTVPSATNAGYVTTAPQQTFTGSGRFIANVAGTNSAVTVPVNVSGFTGTFEVTASTGQGKLSANQAVNAPGATLQIDNGGTFYNATTSDTFGAINVVGTGNGENEGAIRLQSNQTLTVPTITLLGNTTIGAQFSNLGVTGNKIINGVAGTSTLTFGTPNAGQGLVVPANIVDGTGGNGPLAVSVAYASQTGTGITLSGTNAYTGGLTVSPPTSAGTTTALLLNNQNGATGSINVTNVGVTGEAAVLNIGATTQTAVTGATVASGNSITVGGMTGNTGAATLNLVGATGFATTVADNGSISVGRGGIINVGNLSTLNQAGTINISANGGYGATLNVNAGGALNYTGTSGINVNSSGNAGVLSSLIIAGGTLTTGQPIDYNAGTGTGQVTLTGGGTLALSQSIPQLTVNNGAGAAVFQVGTGGGIIDTSTFSTALSTPVTNVSGQTGALTKNGSGTLSLSGASTYTGTTTVNAGAMLVNGSIGSTATPAGAVTVNNNGTLGGTGMLTVASATVNGTLAPGATVGATTGALTLNTTSGVTINGTLAIALGTVGANNLSNNGTFVTTSNGLTINGATLTLTGTPTAGGVYDLVNYTGTLTASGANEGFAMINGPAGYSYSVVSASDFGSPALELDVNPIPEPSTWVFGVLTTAAVGFQLRRRKARNA